MRAGLIPLFLTFFISCLFFSCQQADAQIDAKILTVFSDFVFVGSGEAKFDGDGTVGTTKVAPHAENQQSMPQKVEKRIQYVFHHLDSVNNELMALEYIPAKLSQMGYKITKAPKSAKDLVHLFAGGPLFYIKFSDGVHEGMIFNQLHMDMGKTSDSHDYVLIYIK